MNGPTHQMIGAVAGMTATAQDPLDPDTNLPSMAAYALCGQFGAMLPDIIEPAFRNPHHRQFFHSYLILGGIVFGIKKLVNWVPETEEGKVARKILIVLSIGYASHLLADAITPRGLPLIGKV